MHILMEYASSRIFLATFLCGYAHNHTHFNRNMRNHAYSCFFGHLEHANSIRRWLDPTHSRIDAGSIFGFAKKWLARVGVQYVFFQTAALGILYRLDGDGNGLLNIGGDNS